MFWVGVKRSENYTCYKGVNRISSVGVREAVTKKAHRTDCGEPLLVDPVGVPPAPICGRAWPDLPAFPQERCHTAQGEQAHRGRFRDCGRIPLVITRDNLAARLVIAPDRLNVRGGEERILLAGRFAELVEGVGGQSWHGLAVGPGSKNEERLTRAETVLLLGREI